MTNWNLHLDFHGCLQEYIQNLTLYLPLRPDFITIFSVSWNYTTILSTQVINIKVVSHPLGPTTHQVLSTLYLMYFLGPTSPLHPTSALVQDLRISHLDYCNRLLIGLLISDFAMDWDRGYTSKRAGSKLGLWSKLKRNHGVSKILSDNIKIPKIRIVASAKPNMLFFT